MPTYPAIGAHQRRAAIAQAIDFMTAHWAPLRYDFLVVSQIASSTKCAASRASSMTSAASRWRRSGGRETSFLGDCRERCIELRSLLIDEKLTSRVSSGKASIMRTAGRERIVIAPACASERSRRTRPRRLSRALPDRGVGASLAHRAGSILCRNPADAFQHVAHSFRAVREPHCHGCRRCAARRRPRGRQMR